MRLDVYDVKPDGMTAYLRNYGWHFSKRMCEWAVSKMTDRLGRKFTPYTKDRLDNLLNINNIKINNNKGYDALFVMNMAASDFLGSSIPTENHLIKYVKDYLDDPDGYDEIAFTRFYADCMAKGEPIEWSDMLE